MRLRRPAHAVRTLLALTAVLTGGAAVFSSPARADAITVTGSQTVSPGDQITYTINLLNTGTVAETMTLTDATPSNTTFVSLTAGDVTVNCASPPASVTCTTPTVGTSGTVTWSSTSFPVGTTVFTLTVQVGTGASVAGADIVNSPSYVDSGGNGEDGDSLSASWGTNVTGGSEAQLSLSLTGPAEAVAPSNDTYVLTLVNSGPSASTGTQLTVSDGGNTTFDSLTRVSGPGLTCTTPTVGSSGTITCGGPSGTLAVGTTSVYDIVLSPTGATTGFNETADLAATNVQPGGDGVDAATGDIVRAAFTEIVPGAAAEVTVSGPSTVTAGADASYTITATNGGPDSVDELSFTDELPTGTSFGSLTQSSGPSFALAPLPPGSTGSIGAAGFQVANGSSAQFILTVLVNCAAPNPLSDTVALTSTEPNTTPAAASASTAANNTTPSSSCEPSVSSTQVSQGGSPVTDPAGGTVSSDPPGTAPSPANPVVAAVTSPQGGTVSIAKEGAGPSQSGFNVLGQSVVITAPPATIDQPLVVDFSLSVSLLPGGALPADVTVFRNGVAVGSCPGSTVAVPDPCVSGFTVQDGVVSVQVLTSHASSWSFGTTQVGRVAGADRDATAAAVSQASFPSGRARVVVLARDNDYADALAGAPLAAAKGGPILLTPPGSLPSATLAELHRVLGAGGVVYILGGPNAVSDSVASAVVAAGYTPERLAGADRYQTAATIAAAVPGPTRAYLASGTGFPDGLAAGAAAAHNGGVVLLTAGSAPSAATTAYLTAHPALAITAVGGPASAAYPKAAALVGADRYATALMVAGTFSSPPGAGLASGLDYPDALSAGPALAALGEPLLLTDPATLPAAVATYLHGLAADATVHVYGGSAAVTDAVTQAAQAALS